jgi:AraC-like DNA-binding protein
LESLKRAYSKPAPGNNLRQDEIGKLYALRNHLEQHFLDEMSLPQLARICTLNEFKLKKGFRQLFGTTVFGFIQQLRMEYSGKLLRDTRTSIAETASIAGYQHAHHFSSAFKKHFGVTPTDWIKYL